SIEGNTRINVKIRAQEETEINGKGPKLSADELDKFKAKFDNLTADDTVIFAGSLLPELGDDFYFDLIKIIRR
ncbi:MAG: 1-phosphofructokinase, partial [Acinetobacter sp.]|nr:1-phosphofructokinase [Acinetobacter sp.]